MKNNKQYLIIFFLVIAFSITGCTQKNVNDKKKLKKIDQITETLINYDENKYKVTFIELGSVRCIPCQKMQPIMKSIEAKFSKDVKVIFYDVWTEEGKSYATEYKINLIPTQVFLDENGKEFFRHEGFFPEEELTEVLKSKIGTEN